MKHSILILMVTFIFGCDWNHNQEVRNKNIKIGNFRTLIDTNWEIFYEREDSMTGTINIGYHKVIEFIAGNFVLPKGDEFIQIYSDSTNDCIKYLFTSNVNKSNVYVVFAYNPKSKTNLFSDERYDGVQLVL